MNKLFGFIVLCHFYSFAQQEENNNHIQFNGVYTNNVTCLEDISKEGPKRFIKFYPNGNLEYIPVVCTVTVLDTKDWWSGFSMDDDDFDDADFKGTYKIRGKKLIIFLSENRQLQCEITQNGIRETGIKLFISGEEDPYKEYSFIEEYTFKKIDGLK